MKQSTKGVRKIVSTSTKSEPVTDPPQKYPYLTPEESARVEKFSQDLKAALVEEFSVPPETFSEGPSKVPIRTLQPGWREPGKVTAHIRLNPPKSPSSTEK